MNNTFTKNSFDETISLNNDLIKDINNLFDLPTIAISGQKYQILFYVDKFNWFHRFIFKYIFGATVIKNQE